jgi:hypothetical protein
MNSQIIPTSQGQIFFHSILTYFQLVLEAFMVDGHISQEKLVQFAISFMSKDVAARWAERCLSTVLFLFPTWTGFEAKFCLQFVEENEQDQRLHGHSCSGHQVPLRPQPADQHGGYNIWNRPCLTDYAGWREHAFWQYKVFARVRTGNTPAHPPVCKGTPSIVCSPLISATFRRQKTFRVSTFLRLHRRLPLNQLTRHQLGILEL